MKKMKKIIKKWGSSNVIILSAEDMKIYKLKEGDVVDIELCKEEKRK